MNYGIMLADASKIDFMIHGIFKYNFFGCWFFNYNCSRFRSSLLYEFYFGTGSRHRHGKGRSARCSRLRHGIAVADPCS